MHTAATASRHISDDLIALTKPGFLLVLVITFSGIAFAIGGLLFFDSIICDFIGAALAAAAAILLRKFLFSAVFTLSLRIFKLVGLKGRLIVSMRFALT